MRVRIGRVRHMNGRQKELKCRREWGGGSGEKAKKML